MTKQDAKIFASVLLGDIDKIRNLCEAEPKIYASFLKIEKEKAIQKAIRATVQKRKV